VLVVYVVVRAYRVVIKPLSEFIVDKKSPPVFHPSFFGPRYWPTWLLLFFSYLIGRLPVAVGLAIGRGIGFLFRYAAPARRRIAEANIALCFPELSAVEQQRLVKGVLASCGESIMESAMSLWGPSDKFRARHKISGIEHLEKAKAAGQGVLLVGCHFTTMDVAARILSFYHPFDMLYRKDPNPLLAYKLIQAREGFAGKAIVRTDTRQLIKRLRQGRVVWYAPDQDYGIKHSVFVPFFGVQAATITATSKIAQLGNAIVLPFIHYRHDSGDYEVIIQPPLDGFPSSDEAADATRINQIFEQAIRLKPDQYLWVHRRFKTRPVGEAKVYTR